MTVAHPPEKPGRRRRLSLRFLITPRWIALILGCLAFAYACWTFLAPWQFGRNSQQSAQNSAIAAAAQAAPVPVGTYLSLTREPAADAIWRDVTATGTFDPSGQALVRLRSDANGNPASEVIIPFRLTDGRILLVDRGYVPANQVAPPPAPPSGEVTISGRVQDDETDPRHRAPVMRQGRLEFYAIDGGQIVPGASGTRLMGYVQLQPHSPGVLTAVPMPQIDNGPFLSYAIQWIIFGIFAIAGVVFFIYREITDPRDPDDHVDADADAARSGELTGSASGPQPSADGELVPAAVSTRREQDEHRGTVVPATSAAGGPDVSGSRPRRRRSRDGFDPTQLYDD